jgi:hypothetical protein
MRAPEGEAAIFKTTGTHRSPCSFVWCFPNSKAGRGSDRRGGEPLFAVQEAAAAAQRAQRAVEIDSGGDQRP